MHRKPHQFVFIIFLIVVGSLSIEGYTQAATQVKRFPYEVSFTDGEKPKGISEDFSTTIDRYTSKGLVLTNNTGQFAGVGLGDVKFDVTYGLVVEFDYFMYGGKTHHGVYGDGISAFLYDGDKRLSMGVMGSGLGYANNASSNGLDGAYLGIGLDAFGNFKNEFGTGIPKPSTNGGKWYPNESNHITMRAGMGKTRREGYAVLWTKAGKWDHKQYASAAINWNNGTYTYGYGIAGQPEFEVRPGSENLSNHFRMELVPSSAGGYLITIVLKHQNGETTVVKDYHYGTGSFKYREGGKEKSMDGQAPKSFKLGFGASTGAASQVQIIKNIKVELPYMPEMGDDEIKFCRAGGRTHVLQPFWNDAVYNGALTGKPTKGNDGKHVDYSSFLFENDQGQELAKVTNGKAVYTQSGVGTWTYDVASQTITLVRLPTFKGEATLYYSVKGKNTNGGPFGGDIYRSRITKITLRGENCGAMINPTLRSKG